MAGKGEDHNRSVNTSQTDLFTDLAEHPRDPEEAASIHHLRDVLRLSDELDMIDAQLRPTPLPELGDFEPDPPTRERRVVSRDSEEIQDALDSEIDKSGFTGRTALTRVLERADAELPYDERPKPKPRPKGLTPRNRGGLPIKADGTVDASRVSNYLKRKSDEPPVNERYDPYADHPSDDDPELEPES